ncbi:Het-C-domain-containing protein [Cystobasidium minutum MCA 4210]|uniref:Het-C-domain-containing protein n=1 Tax=Cystobasidium minutum MCA 4210 TaxID=1397322 RepID=UPI0034CDA831|eukprot:jgi/Rhomi1/208531/estExt_Genemark1.C_2_t10217
MAPSASMSILFIALVALCMANGARAFGAGEIPDVSAMAKIAYRHGTIENVLEHIAKSATNNGPGAGRLIAGVAGALLSGNAGGLANAFKGGETFSGLDIKRVYFGNWLRDYSQAMDIAGLSKLSGDSILLVVMCLGFMAFGYATEEFEVTKENLGVYLCTEHIDNPKGYSSDAQHYDMRLRPPVKDEELEIDPNNGMKKYIATEGQGFDTSTYCIRMHLRKCIELGRNGGEKERYEAYRELGTALHTLEDFLAHSNYLELALNKLGHRNVFCHVGENVRVHAPNGQNVPPIVTGTFGGSDFLVSVMGEVGDKLSSSTVNDLNAKFNDAKQQNEQKGNGVQLVKALMSKIGSGGNSDVDSQLDNVEEIRKNAINIDPSKIASKEVQKIFIDVLRTRDSIFKNIEHTLEQLGLDQYIDELTNALSILVLTTLEPYVAPIIKTVTEGLTAGSSAILQQEDQLLVFNDDDASDPTHSVLSKDHFDLWLNEPAGLVAIEVVKHTVPLIVQAWGDHSIDADQVITVILQALHHPYFALGDSEVQTQMLNAVRAWIDGMDSTQRNKVINSLTKESVKNGNNKREGSESYGVLGHQCGPGHAHHGQPGGAGNYGSYGGHGGNHQLATGNRLAGNPAQHRFGEEQSQSAYGHSSNQASSGMGIAGGFGAMQQSIGSRMEDRYGRQQHDNNDQGYGRQEHSASQGYGRQEHGGNQGYTSSRPQTDFAGHSEPVRYGGSNQYGSQQQQQHFRPSGNDDDNDGRSSYHRNEDNEGSYGRRTEQSGFQGGQTEYGSSGFGGRRDDNKNNEAYHRRNDEDRHESYGGGQYDRSHQGYGHNDDNDRPQRRHGYGDDNDGSAQGDYQGGGYRRHEEHDQSSGYGQSRHESSYGREEEEHRAETRYGGENLGSRFGAMNLSGGGRDDDGHHGRRYDDNDNDRPQGRHGGFDGGYGGGRRDDDNEYGHRRRGDDNDNDNQPMFRTEGGGRYGRNNDNDDDNGQPMFHERGEGYGSHYEGLHGYRGDEGSHGKNRKSDSSDEDKKKKKDKKSKEYKKQDSTDSDDEKRYKKEKTDSDDEQKRYKKEMKKAEKMEKKSKKDYEKSDDDSDSDDEKKSKKYGRKYSH